MIRAIKTIGFAFVALLFVFVALNFWPRTMEPELWENEYLEMTAESLPTDSQVKKAWKESNNKRDEIATAAADGRMADFLDLWAKRFQEDQEALSVYPTPVGQQRFLYAIVDDLLLLKYAKGQLGQEEWNVLARAVSAFDLEQVSFHRTIVAMYRCALRDVRSITVEAKGLGRILFNSEMTRQELNDIFRGYEKFVKGRKSDISEPMRWPLWWIVNKSGKAAVSLVVTNQADRIRSVFVAWDAARQAKIDLFADIFEKN